MAAFDVQAYGTVSTTVDVPENESPEQIGRDYYVENFHGNYPAVDDVVVKKYNRKTGTAEVEIHYSVTHGATADSEEELRTRLKSNDYPDGIDLHVHKRD